MEPRVNEKFIVWFRCEGMKHEASYLELFIVVSLWGKAVIFHSVTEKQNLIPLI